MCEPIGVCMCFLGEYAQECERVQAGPGGLGDKVPTGLCGCIRFCQAAGRGLCRHRWAGEQSVENNSSVWRAVIARG